MSSVRRRILGVVLLGFAALCLLQPPLIRSATGDRPPTLTASASLPGFSEPASLLALVEAAFLAAGAVILLAGITAVSGRRLAPRGSLAAPGIAAALAVPLTADVPLVSLLATLVADPVVVLEPVGFIIAGAVVGASLAPVVLGANGDDTITLLVGMVVLLVAVFAAPLPAFALVSGVVGGSVAVGVLWVLDPETWRP